MSQDVVAGGGCAETEVLCVGVTPALQRTLRVDGFRPGGVNRVRSVRWTGGGKATNVCRVLHALGARGLLTGFCGGDAGRRFRTLLAAEGVAADLVEVEAETRLCQTVVDVGAGEATELVEEAPLPPPAAWAELAALIRARGTAGRLLVVSGKLPPGAPPDAYRRLLETSAPPGCRVLLDTHLQPLREAAGPGVELVKINAAELAATFGRAPAGAPGWPTGIDALLDAGVRWVLITRGPDPASLAGPGGLRLQFRLPRVEPVNPIGSGDATLAGIAFRILRGDDMPDAVRFGLACGAANTLTDSAGYVRINDVERLRLEVAER